MALRKVVQPEPGRPSTARSSPLLSRPLKPRRMCLGCFLLPFLPQEPKSSPTRSGERSTESTVCCSCRADAEPKTSRSLKRTPRWLALWPCSPSCAKKTRTHFLTSKSAESGFRAGSESRAASGPAAAWDRRRERAVAMRWSSAEAPSSSSCGEPAAWEGPLSAMVSALSAKSPEATVLAAPLAGTGAPGLSLSMRPDMEPNLS